MTSMLIHRCIILVAVLAYCTDAFSATTRPPTAFTTTSSNSIPQQITSPSPLKTTTPLRKHGETAIVLNTNARSVKPDLIPLANDVFGASNVYVTTTAQEAQDAAKKIAQSGYSKVIPVGGDGTLSAMIQYLSEYCSNAELPLMGYIPMGTGNGLKNVVGCNMKGGLFQNRQKKMMQLKQVMQQLKDANPKTSKTVDLPLMQVTTRDYKHQCFFAGVGFDSLMLNDFKQVKAWSTKRNFCKRSLGSVAGYCVALVTKTLPKCVLQGRHKIKVQVTTRDNKTLWVDHRRGDYCEYAIPQEEDDHDGTKVVNGRRQGDDELVVVNKSVSKNGATKVTNQDTPQLLYSGTTGILAAGTSPFYGGGLRLFPFARMTSDKMHLRLGRIHPLIGFLNIPKIFAGSYRESSNGGFGCLDFIGNDFEIKLEKEYPFQHSGESVGYVDEFRLQVKGKVRFVNFLPERVVVDR